MSKIGLEVLKRMKKPFMERFGDFMAGKGFYIVLFLCVAAIGISGYYLFSSLSPDKDPGTAVAGPAQVTVTPTPASASPAVRVTPTPAPQAQTAVRTTPAPSPTPAPTPAATPQPAAPTVFASRVCKRCPLQSSCWQRDYVSTFNALNDALPAMLERGRGEGEDFPAYFANRCLKFPEFLAAANEEVSALLYRRQYRSRLRENRSAVCRQYGDLADVLGTAAAELGAELVPDPVRERRLRQYLAAQGTECLTAAYYDEAGHLRLELEGQGLAALRKPESVDKLSAVLNVPLRPAEEDGRRDRLVLVEQEPLMAVAGVAARKKDGQTVSGDTGAWFKHDDGSLYVLLCDGMGSGPEAGQESGLAVRLLEQFLRAGVRPEAALKTLNSALALRGEETGGFTTVDLLRLDLFTGEAAVYKYGAAPTYVRKGKTVSRITGSALPAGLAGGDGAAPDVAKVRLEAGDWVLLVTDGVAGSDSDLWVRQRFAAFEGESPKDLTQALIDESAGHGGATDDRTALVLRLEKR